MAWRRLSDRTTGYVSGSYRVFALLFLPVDAIGEHNWMANCWLLFPRVGVDQRMFGYPLGRGGSWTCTCQVVSTVRQYANENVGHVLG